MGFEAGICTDGESNSMDKVCNTKSEKRRKRQIK